MKDNSIRYFLWHNTRNAVWHNAQKIIEGETYKSLHWQARHYVEDILNYHYETDPTHKFVCEAARNYFKQNEK